MKNTLVSFVGAAAILAASSSFAADVNRTSAVTFNDSTAYIGDTFGAAQVGKTFSDNFTFNIASDFSLSSAIVSIRLDGVRALSLTGLSLTGPAGTITGLQTSTGALEGWDLEARNLAAGNYILNVLGTVTGKQSGSFGGNINVASAVPEADTYAMLLAGLGVIGAVAWRRKAAGAASVSKTGTLTFA